MSLLFVVVHAVRDAWGQRWRAGFAALGLAWGTCAVCLLLALGLSLRGEMSRTLRGLGEGIVIAWPSATTLPFAGLGRGRTVRLDESDIVILRQEAPEIAAISGEYRRELGIVHGRKSATPLVSGVHPDYARLRGFAPRPGGRFVSDLDLAHSRRVVFLGDKLAAELFGPRADPVGRTVMLGGASFTVIGVMAPRARGAGFSGRDDANNAYTPATTFRLLAGTRWLSNFIFQARDPADTGPAKARVNAILARRHRFDPADTEAIRLWDTTEHLRFNRTFSTAVLTFLALMGVLILAVAAIGLSNVMNVAVEERTRQIGIQMALGATPRHVAGAFLAETLLVAAAGGAGGLAAAWILCESLAPLTGAVAYLGTPTVSPPVALAATTALGAAAVAAGYPPARAAARLDPVAAIRSGT